MSEFDPDWTISPGALLRELVDERGWTVSYGARACRIDLADFEDVLNGTMAVDDTIAGKIAIGTGTSARFWLNAERMYRDALAAGKRDVSDE